MVWGDNEFGVTLLAANLELQEWTADYLGYEETGCLPLNRLECRWDTKLNFICNL